MRRRFLGAILLAAAACSSAGPRTEATEAPGELSSPCDGAVAVGVRAAQEGPVPGFAGLTTEGQWRDACERFSPWVRRCLELSERRDDLVVCTPGEEPWSRSHDIVGPPEAEEQAFLACVAAAQDRAALARCDYD